jgi:hypothetical protein
LVSFQTTKQLLSLALVVPADLADDEMGQEGSRKVPEQGSVMLRNQFWPL